MTEKIRLDSFNDLPASSFLELTFTPKKTSWLKETDNNVQLPFSSGSYKSAFDDTQIFSESGEAIAVLKSYTPGKNFGDEEGDVSWNSLPPGRTLASWRRVS